MAVVVAAAGSVAFIIVITHISGKISPIDRIPGSKENCTIVVDLTNAPDGCKTPRPAGWDQVRPMLGTSSPSPRKGPSLSETGRASMPPPGLLALPSTSDTQGNG